MTGYTKVLKEKTKTEENEIRVTSKGQIKKYLGYALRVLTKTDMQDLVIRATGNAIVKALILIEIVKRRVGDLHQINEITSTEIVDEFKAQVEGLENVVQKRRVTCLDCRLSKVPLDETHIGYQAPQPKDPSIQFHEGEGHEGGERRPHPRGPRQYEYKRPDDQQR